MAVFNLAQYFTQDGVESFQDLLAPISAFARGINVAGAAKDDVLRVPLFNCATGSAAFSYSTGYTGTNTTALGKSVTLSNLIYQPIQLTDADVAQLAGDPSAAKRMINQAVRKLASDVISASFASVVTQANFPSSGSYTSAQYSASTAPLANLDKFANDNKWTDRQIVAGTTLWNSLMQNSAVTAASNFGSAEVVQKGSLSQVYGFTPYKVTVALPNGDTGFIVNSNAIAIGFAYHKPADGHNYQIAQPIVDGLTGIPMGYRQWYDQSKATTNIILDVLHGALAIDSTALYHIK